MMYVGKTPSLLFALATITFNLLLWNTSRAYGTSLSRGISKSQLGVTSGVTHVHGESTVTGVDKGFDQQRASVVICGGGPGGLLASILLNQIGVPSTVVEQAKENTAWGIKSYTMILNDKGKASLARGRCLEEAIEAGEERYFTGLFNATTGEMKKIPKKSSTLAITRHRLVQTLEDVVSGLPNVCIRKGVGILEVSKSEDKPGLMQVDMEDGSSIFASHVIGADGKWSKVRRSASSFSGAIITCPSAAVHMNLSKTPNGWDTDGTYLLKPTNKECKFYIIASSLPGESGMSISMIYYDETIEKYPWLAPPESIQLISDDDDDDDDTFEGWDNDQVVLDNESSQKTSNPPEITERLKVLFEKELPKFADLLDEDAYRTAVVKRRTTWLQMNPLDDNDVSYSSTDGRISLIGDAAHAMTPSLGEGCNTALESAVVLADHVTESMRATGERFCTVDAMSRAFRTYGRLRPKECIAIQQMSASKSTLSKQ